MSHSTDSKARAVMIIDDDKDILTTLTRGLENDGFKVHGFSDPLLALEHVENGCHECGLAVCDVSMPNMTGFQLARRIRDLRADIRIIFMTAFEVNKNEFSRVFPSTDIENVIRKPFTPSKLAEIVKDAYASSKA